MDENVNENKMDEFLMKVGNKHFFCEKMNKKNKVEIFYVGLF
jgi:hypothetical protein